MGLGELAWLVNNGFYLEFWEIVRKKTWKVLKRISEIISEYLRVRIVMVCCLVKVKVYMVMFLLNYCKLFCL